MVSLIVSSVLKHQLASASHRKLVKAADTNLTAPLPNLISGACGKIGICILTKAAPPPGSPLPPGVLRLQKYGIASLQLISLGFHSCEVRVFFFFFNIYINFFTGTLDEWEMKWQRGLGSATYFSFQETI